MKIGCDPHLQVIKEARMLGDPVPQCSGDQTIVRAVITMRLYKARDLTRINFCLGINYPLSIDTITNAITAAIRPYIKIL